MVIDHANQETNSPSRGESKGLMRWVGKHPAICLLGALVLGTAVWATAMVVKSTGDTQDVEEVPLFI